MAGAVTGDDVVKQKLNLRKNLSKWKNINATLLAVKLPNRLDELSLFLTPPAIRHEKTT